MRGPRIHAFVLGASLLLAGCTTDDAVDFLLENMADAAAREPEPAPPEVDASYGDPAPVEEKPEWKATRIVAGAWGFDGRVQGKAEGAPSEHGMDAKSIPGFSLEARFHGRGEGGDGWSTFGVLLEHFRAAEDKEVAGGKARNEGALSGIWLVLGEAGKPRMDGRGSPADFDHRIDLMVGLRRGFAQVEVPAPSGGTYRRSSTWGEVAFGLRAEVSPIRRVFLFARGDVGSEWNDRFHSDEEETKGDAALGSISSQFMAGLRVRPVDHLSLVAGWRFLRLDGRVFNDDGTDDIPKAKVTFSGPWAGVELDF